MIQLSRGAKLSPRHRLAGATPHRALSPTPPQWLWLPSQLSMWGNDVDGDCVTAEEAFAKACNVPEIFIPDATVVAWAAAGGFLNGADLITVLDAMQTGGFSLDGSTQDDGPPSAVDWTNASILQNAISQGPVKIAIAADQIQNVVQNVPNFPANGWFADGVQSDDNTDHCVSLCGYGSVEWLAVQLGVSPPNPDQGADQMPAYAMFTWSSVGIITVPSMLAITREAWLRNPTTVTR